ncbi:MAG: diguanylate cyclase [Anaerovoracaceae bacterium]
MVNNTERLLKQIMAIIMSKPILEEDYIVDEEFKDIQKAVAYLSKCTLEANQFLRELAKGELDASPPDRHNFLAGHLKELHAGLKHLTWQANQVANGDYNQKVSFLGSFSNSFNAMISQLEDRENKLRKQTNYLEKSMDLLIAVMDGLTEWIVVTEESSGDILYINKSASKEFYNPECDEFDCGGDCVFMEDLRSYKDTDKEQILEYTCPKKDKTLYAKSFIIQWDGKRAYAHLISDVTGARVEKRELENLAFLDALTGAYNRRFCIQSLNKFMDKKELFAISLIDLDGLKYVNDNFGHVNGDLYIKLVAEEMMRMSSDDGEIICRVGGDEFIILFPNDDEISATQKMKKLSEKISQEKKEFPVSISFGVLDYNDMDNMSIEEILSHVDAKMYVQKNIKKANHKLPCYDRRQFPR